MKGSDEGESGVESAETARTDRGELGRFLRLRLRGGARGSRVHRGGARGSRTRWGRERGLGSSPLAPVVATAVRPSAAHPRRPVAWRGEGPPGGKRSRRDPSFPTLPPSAISAPYVAHASLPALFVSRLTPCVAPFSLANALSRSCAGRSLFRAPRRL